MIHDTISIGVFKPDDLADWVIGAGSLDVLHVSPPLGNIHSAVSVPHAHGGLGNHRIVRD